MGRRQKIGKKETQFCRIPCIRVGVFGRLHNAAFHRLRGALRLLQRPEAPAILPRAAPAGGSPAIGSTTVQVKTLKGQYVKFCQK